MDPHVLNPHVKQVDRVKTSTGNSSKFISAKAKRSKPRLLTLLACVSYLLFNLLGVDLGLRLINGYTEPRLHRAEAQLRAANSGLFAEQRLLIEFDGLMTSNLDRRYMESDEHCLARALYQIDDVFLGIPWWKDPDVRNRAVEWATDNCHKLLYTPQLHTPNTFSVWTTANRLRRDAIEAFFIHKYHAVVRVYQWLGLDPWSIQVPSSFKHPVDAIKQPDVPLKMPFGFALDYNGPFRCRLVYSGLSDPTWKTSRDAIAEARKQVNKWAYPFEEVFRTNGRMIRLLASLQLLLGNLALFAVLLSRGRPRPQPRPMSPLSARLAGRWKRTSNTVAQFQEDEQLVIGLIINAALYVLLRYQLKNITSEFDRSLLPVGAGFCALHIPQILFFFDPLSEKMESMHSACRSVKELYLITQGHQLSQSIPKKQIFSGRVKPSSSPAAKPASKIAARFISPLTSISEDIQQERRALYAARSKQPRVDFEPEVGYATETDSNYDSNVQEASYVNLPDGATLKVSENESEWSIVEK
ncbi:hypothetical protein EJ07DRAFT_184553 [Lizonia empirigonia]|nr:hypothetical protein EJ07DRAFT_184553 [Lizonia empirigonia]